MLVCALHRRTSLDILSLSRLALSRETIGLLLLLIYLGHMSRGVSALPVEVIDVDGALRI